MVSVCQLALWYCITFHDSVEYVLWTEDVVHSGIVLSYERFQCWYVLRQCHEEVLFCYCHYQSLGGVKIVIGEEVVIAGLVPHRVVSIEVPQPDCMEQTFWYVPCFLRTGPPFDIVDGIIVGSVTKDLHESGSRLTWIRDTGTCHPQSLTCDLCMTCAGIPAGTCDLWDVRYMKVYIY